jgi:hypothetical protein
MTARPIAAPPSHRRGWFRPVFFGIVAIVLVVAAGILIGRGVRGYHDSVALAGHSADTRPVRLTVGNAPLEIPANMIRTGRQRRGGVMERVDLVVTWPDLDGYSAATAEVFRDGSPLAPLVYLSLVPADSPLDADARLDTVYARFFAGEPMKGPSGLTGRSLAGASGYEGEEVFYSAAGDRRFVARCVAKATKEMPATCIRDVVVAPGLSLLYRFNRFYLGDWRAMDEGLRELVATFRLQR